MRTTATRDQLIKEFISEQDVCQLSKSHYEGIVFQFFVYCEINGIDWKQVSKANIIAYKERLLHDHKASSTIDLYLTVVRKFFHWCSLKNYYDNVAQGIRGTRKKVGFKKKPLSDAQVIHLFASIDRTTLDGMRDSAIISLMIKSGIRSCEVIRGSIGDIRYHNDIAMFYVLGKGRHDKAYQPMTNRTQEWISDYLNARGVSSDKEPLFMSHTISRHRPLTSRGLKWIIDKRLKDAGIMDPLITPHSFRHTYACSLVLDGVQITEVQSLMRHSNIASTMVYVNYIQDIQKDHTKTGKLLDERF